VDIFERVSSPLNEIVRVFEYSFKGFSPLSQDTQDRGVPGCELLAIDLLSAEGLHLGGNFMPQGELILGLHVLNTILGRRPQFIEPKIGRNFLLFLLFLFLCGCGQHLVKFLTDGCGYRCVLFSFFLICLSLFLYQGADQFLVVFLLS
jgi:hypothetical protein